MRYLGTVILSLMLVMGLAFSCKKWEDPVSTEQPQITRPYCNDPDAVNYNWDFPGRVDNSVCFYPSDLFEGQYRFRDTVYASQSELYLLADSMDLQITKISKTQISVSGFCKAGQRLLVTAGAAYLATIDTLVGDSLTAYPGQLLCRQQDTVTGTFTRDKVDSSLVYVSLIIKNDTGITIHTGRAIRK